MKKIKAKINFKDKRGVISDLIEKEKDKRYYIYFIFKNKVRANHYHKKLYSGIMFLWKEYCLFLRLMGR